MRVRDYAQLVLNNLSETQIPDQDVETTNIIIRALDDVINGSPESWFNTVSDARDELLAMGREYEYDRTLEGVMHLIDTNPDLYTPSAAQKMDRIVELLQEAYTLIRQL